MKNTTGVFTHFVPATPANIKIAYAIERMFAGVKIQVKPDVIYFEAIDHVTIVSIREAYK